MDIIDIIFPFIFVSTAVTTVILIQDSRDADGEQVYNTSTLVLVMEMVKIAISLVLVAYEGRMKELQAVSLSEFLKFAIPAFLYCINNNIFVHIFTVLEPTVFLLICNIRVIWVAIIYSFCMKRTITR